MFPLVDLTSSCVSVDFASQEPFAPMESPEKIETKGVITVVCTLTVKSVYGQ